MVTKPNRTPEERLVDEMMARFDFAYKKAFDHFERMERIQNQFNNTINPLQWPTISEIADPVTFVAVEEQLPFAMRYLRQSTPSVGTSSFLRICSGSDQQGVPAE